MRPVLFALLLTALLPLGGEEGLLQRAEARREAARAQLAAGRQQRLQEQQELAGRIAALQRQLAELRRRGDEQAAETAALQQRADEAGQEERRLQARSGRLQGQLRQALGLPEGAPAEPASVNRAIDARLAELRASAEPRVLRRQVHARDGEAVTVPVIELGSAAALAAGPEAASAGLLRRADDGSWLVAGPRPGEAQLAALQRAAAGEAARLPLDVSGELALRPAEEAWSAGGWLRAGGLFVWPIIAVAVAALLLFGERLAALAVLRTPPRLAGRVLEALQEGRRQEALRLARAESPMARVLTAGIQAWEADRERREAALESALLAEELRLERGLRLLAVLAAIAPLLGLLGTVTGMIGTFEVIAVHGTGDPRMLSGGISEALITTQLGLIVAVPILLLHAVLARVVERRQTLLEQAATALLSGGNGRPTVATPTPDPALPLPEQAS